MGSLHKPIFGRENWAPRPIVILDPIGWVPKITRFSAKLFWCRNHSGFRPGVFGCRKIEFSAQKRFGAEPTGLDLGKIGLSKDISASRHAK